MRLRPMTTRRTIMNDAGGREPAAPFAPLIPAETLAAEIDRLAEALSERMEGDWTVVVILLGAIPFAADLMRALSRQGRHPMLDALWLESYGDAKESSGRVAVRADLKRPIAGRGALLLDDVYDTGRTFQFAKAHVLGKGAREAVSCALVRKPGAAPGLDYCGLEAPDRFLVGYGMDVEGRYRGLPYIGDAQDA